MEINNESQVADNVVMPEPVETGPHLSGSWMTVQEAVAYCVAKGLPRTSKTVRKWAQRSIVSAGGIGEIAVQRQDTENGFRWLVGRESLDVKIEQEKELAHRIEAEPVAANTFGPVHTGTHTSEPVGTGARTESTEIVSLLKKQLERAEHQLDVKDKQIDALLERDRETNILIQGLQTSLTGVVNALPSGRRGESHETNRYVPPQSQQGSPIRDA